MGRFQDSLQDIKQYLFKLFIFLKYLQSQEAVSLYECKIYPFFRWLTGLLPDLGNAGALALSDTWFSVRLDRPEYVLRAFRLFNYQDLTGYQGKAVKNVFKAFLLEPDHAGITLVLWLYPGSFCHFTACIFFVFRKPAGYIITGC